MHKFFFFQAEDGIRDVAVTGVQTCALPIFIVDASGKITLVNAQTEKLFGYKREELLGKTVENLMPERFRGNHLGHREQYAKAPRLRMMGSGMELFGRHKDGTEFPVEISLSPFKSKDGILVFSAIRDITLQRQARKELAEAKERSEEHTSELQSRLHLVCRLLLEKKKILTSNRSLHYFTH